MPKFEKGKSGNPNGRPKGSISEKTRIWNEIGEWFANDALMIYKDNLTAMMSSTDRKERALAMQRYETLLEYFKPKLSRTEVKAEIKDDSIDTSKLSDETLKRLEDELNSDTDTSGDS